MIDGFDLLKVPPGPRTVADRGRPALCLPHEGMPAYESESGTLLVMESLIAFFGGKGDSGAPLLLPVSYGMATLRAPSGLTALHDDPDAIWSWRPVIYTLKITTTERMGSQQELAYRRGLHDVNMVTADLQDEGEAFMIGQVKAMKKRYGRIPSIVLQPGERKFRLPKNARKKMFREYRAFIEELNSREQPDLPYQLANKKAEALLREYLSPQQRLDLACDDCFYVRGTINRLYCIRLGNGAAIVHPETHEEMVSLCIHPDDWIPNEDVALSLKMMIESGPEGEEELLAGARARPLGPSPKPTAEDRYAWDIERSLLPAPLVTA